MKRLLALILGLPVVALAQPAPQPATSPPPEKALNNSEFKPLIPSIAPIRASSPSRW